MAMTIALVLVMLGFSVLLGLTLRRIGAAAHAAIYAMAVLGSVLYLMLGLPTPGR